MGTIHGGGMGSGTPAMRGIGLGTAELIQDGCWIAGDYEQDQFLDDGTFVMKWQLHGYVELPPHPRPQS